MNIVGKRYRSINEVDLLSEVGFRNQYYKHKGYIYIYIYNSNLLFTSSKELDQAIRMGSFGKANHDLAKTIEINLKKRLKNNNHPAGNHYSVKDRKYLLVEHKSKSQSGYYFKGEILLNGDALRGTFYNNEEVTVSEQVYYNLEKPLPNPLIPENKNID